MQSLPLELKIIKSQQRIREWYEHWQGNTYISVSGKDSMVVYDLVKKQYPNTPAVFCNTGLEWPEVIANIKTLDNVEIIRPKMNFKDVIDKYGYPVVSKEQSWFIYQYRTTKSEKLKNYRWYGDNKKRFKISEKWKYLVDAPFKVSSLCCDVMKKRPFEIYEKKTGRKPFLGVMAADSRQRKGQYLRHGGCNAFNLKKRPRSNPIGFWVKQDVLQYIFENKISYPACYGDLVVDNNGIFKMSEEPNTGCMFCMFGVHMESEPNKFQRMKLSHPKQYDYCINKLGLGEVLDYIGVKY